MANKLSLYGLLSVNGTFNSTVTQNLTDLATEKIAYVSVVKAKTPDNRTVDAFEIVCPNLKGVTPDVYLLEVNASHCASIDAFFTGLTTISADTTFTKYTSLLSIDGSSVASKSVIINDLYTKNRRYVPVRGTLVFVDIHNAYQAKEFLFLGNQTVAGTYTYFPS